MQLQYLVYINLYTSRIKFFLSLSLPTWHTTPDTDSFPYCSRSESTALSTFDCLRLLTITLAPSLANLSAIAYPIL